MFLGDTKTCHQDFVRLQFGDVVAHTIIFFSFMERRVFSRSCYSKSEARYAPI